MREGLSLSLCKLCMTCTAESGFTSDVVGFQVASGVGVHNCSSICDAHNFFTLACIRLRQTTVCETLNTSTIQYYTECRTLSLFHTASWPAADT